MLLKLSFLIDEVIECLLVVYLSAVVACRGIYNHFLWALKYIECRVYAGSGADKVCESGTDNCRDFYSPDKIDSVEVAGGLLLGADWLSVFIEADHPGPSVDSADGVSGKVAKGGHICGDGGYVGAEACGY